MDEVEITKKYLLQFFRIKVQKNLERIVKEAKQPPFLAIAEDIIEIFGWVYPQDVVCCLSQIFNKYYPDIDTSKWLDEWESR